MASSCKNKKKSRLYILNTNLRRDKIFYGRARSVKTSSSLLSTFSPDAGESPSSFGGDSIGVVSLTWRERVRGAASRRSSVLRRARTASSCEVFWPSFSRISAAATTLVAFDSSLLVDSGGGGGSSVFECAALRRRALFSFSYSSKMIFFQRILKFVAYKFDSNFETWMIVDKKIENFGETFYAAKYANYSKLSI